MEVIETDINDWKNKTDDRNSKGRWQKIEWKGKLTYQSRSNHPHVDEFKLYFDELYKHGDVNDIVIITCVYTHTR